MSAVKVSSSPCDIFRIIQYIQCKYLNNFSLHMTIYFSHFFNRWIPNHKMISFELNSRYEEFERTLSHGYYIYLINILPFQCYQLLYGVIWKRSRTVQKTEPRSKRFGERKFLEDMSIGIYTWLSVRS